MTGPLRVLPDLFSLFIKQLNIYRNVFFQLCYNIVEVLLSYNKNSKVWYKEIMLVDDCNEIGMKMEDNER